MNEQQTQTVLYKSEINVELGCKGTLIFFGDKGQVLGSADFKSEQEKKEEK